MIDDFLIAVSDAGSELTAAELTGSELAGPKLRDMCKDVGSTLLFSGLVVFLLVSGVLPLSFLVEGREVDLTVLVNSGFNDLGVDIIGDFAIDAAGFLAIVDAGFFLEFGVSTVLFAKVV